MSEESNNVSDNQAKYPNNYFFPVYAHLPNNDMIPAPNNMHRQAYASLEFGAVDISLLNKNSCARS